MQGLLGTAVEVEFGDCGWEAGLARTADPAPKPVLGFGVQGLVVVEDAGLVRVQSRPVIALLVQLDELLERQDDEAVVGIPSRGEC